MKKQTLTFLAGFSLTCLLPLPSIAVEAAALPSAAQNAVPDSGQMEADLQRLPWSQFKSIVEAVPKLKADVDAYGPFGWEYVKKNYTSYHWKKNIDRLDPTQKQQLAELIQTAKAGK